MTAIRPSFAKTGNQLDNFYSIKESEHYKCALTAETIQFEMLLPRDYSMIQSRQKMPLFIVFDEQNQGNYKNTLNTIDYLTTLSNMPSSCILGIGFKDGMQRFMLSNYSDETVSLEPFLKDVKALAETLLAENEIELSNVIVIGHSRTGYIASQFLFNYPTFVTAAIVGSAQDISSKKEVAIFENFLKTIGDQKLKRYFLYSSGRENWGDADEEQTSNMMSFFENYKKNSCFISKGQQFDCDHYNSLGYGLNGSLSYLFQGHNYAIQEAFKLLNSGSKLNYNQADYAAIYKQVSDSTGIQIEMDVSFYVSLFYGYLNDYFEHYKDNKMVNAEQVLNEAITRFDTDYRFVLHYATFLLEKGQPEEAKAYFAAHTQLFQYYKWKNEQLLLDEMDQFNELFEE